MVWAENKPLRGQLRESAVDIDCAKARAISPDGDNFVITQLGDSIDRIFKSGREIPAHLPVNAGPISARLSRRSEKVNIGAR